MSFNKCLTPTRQRLVKGIIYGFDIETHNKNKSFTCATIYRDDLTSWVFRDKQKLIDFLKTKRFWNSIIVATNLGFDFFGTFFNTKEIKEFDFLFRGSSLIYAKSNIRGREFHKRQSIFNKYGKKQRIKGYKLTFLDTVNYCGLSVKALGKLLKLPKLSHPKFLGKKPKNKAQWNELITYNRRDAEISKKYMEFLYDSFEKLGASHKLTIASTSMSLFRNKYLKNKYWVHDTEELLEIFNAYYGGRTEVFSRGTIKDFNYYDINSLYPYVMKKIYPDPNTKRITYKDNPYYINNFNGVSKVSVYCPYMDYPFLPYRSKDKLLFPTGYFTGWYSHIELRYAVKLGYVIKKVHKTYYYKDNCIPFRKFVNDMYKLRMDFKRAKNPMELVVKIIMNSLYGKFGQKFLDRDEWQPLNHTLEELNKLPFFERHGDYIRIKKDYSEPSIHCIPIWALYTTAYARIELYILIKNHKAVYCDTDSLITKDFINVSDELGKLKLEMKINSGILVKPKCYAVVGDNKTFVKIKGIGRRLTFSEFTNFVRKPKITYMKFMKFKESVRRGFIPNELLYIDKHMDLEDNKRVWENKFNPKQLNISTPINILE